ncbi:MAG TPA: hypothetical protein VMJ90_05095, partial [Anaerolineales bacterium]|nr:hypothetical protein [Anaerolineales bacterium]
LVGTGGSLLAWVSVAMWLANMPVHFEFSIWQPAFLFLQSPALIADGISWAYSFSIAALCLAIIVTSVVRVNFPSPFNWSGILILTSLGILAVVAGNPLTLVLIWAGIDLVELTNQLRSVEHPKLRERVVIAFASRVGGTILLLWADMVGAANGQILDFHTGSPQAGLYLLLAASLRLGVLPLHLPYPGESAIRRGFGTWLRMISTASSLILLARIPAGSIAPSITPYLSLLVAFAAIYGSWMWLRSSDELSGRPYLLIGISALSVAAALRANPVGAAAWGCALVLSGGALFLSSEPNRWMIRSLWIAAFGFSSLPLSLTATGWNTNNGSFILTGLPFVVAHALLLAGFIRHIQKPGASRVGYEDQPIWARNIYPFGIGVLLITTIGLGIVGWEGSLQIGGWIAALFASLLTFSLVWATPRFRILNPVRAHWLIPSDSWLDRAYQLLWNSYRQLGRLSNVLTNILEGESGIMWTLLFLALFASYVAQQGP